MIKNSIVFECDVEEKGEDISNEFNKIEAKNKKELTKS